VTPQQRYISELKASYPDYASQLPDPTYSSSNQLVGTAAAILDSGAQLCEALATGGNRAAIDVAQMDADPSTSGSEIAAIVALTQSVLCPVPSAYQSKYQEFANALQAAGVLTMIGGAGPSPDGNPVAFATMYLCGSSSWTSELTGNITQAQANAVAAAAGKYICPGQSSNATVPTVTYTATGGDILYGPAGSLNSGYSGMHITQDIPNPAPIYLAISVTDGNCVLTVTNSDGSTSTSQASAASGLANCELVSIGGAWYNANSS